MKGSHLTFRFRNHEDVDSYLILNVWYHGFKSDGKSKYFSAIFKNTIDYKNHKIL